MTTTSPLDADYTAARQRHTFKHVGYVVDDIAQAVSHWVEALGAGPFFLIDSVTFDDLDYSGGPAVYEHSIAFGRWGPITVELMEFQRIEPESLAARMATPPNRPNHIGYSVSDIHLERAPASRRWERRRSSRPAPVTSRASYCTSLGSVTP